MYFGTEPYGLEGYIENHGDSSNMYRGETFGQPRTLEPGDVLANDLELAEPTYDAGNGGVGLIFTDGSVREVAARIPLLLQGGNRGKLPMQLEVGDIFETGCVMLVKPKKYNHKDSRFEKGRYEVEIKLTGGLSGHRIGVPADLLIALHSETYPPSSNNVLGAFVLQETRRTQESARKNLPRLGQLDLPV